MPEPKSQLQTLQRAFDVVRAVSDAGRPLSTSEIAEAIGTGTTIAHPIVRSLEANGYRPTAVGSGQSALRRAGADHPDVIVMDLLMPGMDGWETLAALRDREETRDIPGVV